MPPREVEDGRTPDPVPQVRALLVPVADPWRAPAMAAYLKGVAPFLGLGILFAACEANLADRDPFMRKGIGWGLRDAARWHPDEVRAFLAAHRDRMSALSIREATRHLGTISG
jgi:3-methyladenine DNA glycosylase AlkD